MQAKAARSSFYRSVQKSVKSYFDIPQYSIDLKLKKEYIVFLLGASLFSLRQGRGGGQATSCFGHLSSWILAATVRDLLSQKHTRTHAQANACTHVLTHKLERQRPTKETHQLNVQHALMPRAKNQKVHIGQKLLPLFPFLWHSHSSWSFPMMWSRITKGLRFYPN